VKFRFWSVTDTDDRPPLRTSTSWVSSSSDPMITSRVGLRVRENSEAGVASAGAIVAVVDVAAGSAACAADPVANAAEPNETSTHDASAAQVLEMSIIGGCFLLPCYRVVAT
jgi:hypothetical protein